MKLRQPKAIELVLEDMLETKKSRRRGNVWRNQSDQTDDPAKRVGRAFVGINERQQQRGGIREEGEAAWCKTVSGKKVLFVSRGIWELSVSVHG